MNVEFLEIAKNELVDAVLYFNEQSEGLGFEFALEIKHAISRITEYPNAWTKLSANTRRCRTNRFPYGIVYQVRGDLILVVAVMHLRKHPDKWKARLDRK